MTVQGFRQKKEAGEKISLLTCYDYTFSKIFSESEIDALLVGDSLAMVIYGHETTVSADIPMMATHTSAVRRGAPKKFIIADMPFLSFRKGLEASVEAAGQLMKAGASAIKLEGSEGNLELINHLVHSGIPVMGHLGLTPQFYHVLGGNRVQGREKEAAETMKNQARALQSAGCFSIVLECIPSILAKEISSFLDIPVIGIGAGADVDGQVLVCYDMLGMIPDKKLKFARKYHAGAEIIKEAVGKYVQDVSRGTFPSEEESFA